MSKPTIKYRLGALELAVWANEKDGRTWHSAKLSRSYKDEASGEWKNTDSLTSRDFANAAALLQRAALELGIDKQT